MLSNVGDIGWFISSITQISSIALEPSSSDEIEGKIDEDDEDEAEVKGKKDEVEHYEIKENILRQPQQVVHGDEISENIGVEGGGKTKLCIILYISYQGSNCNCWFLLKTRHDSAPGPAALALGRLNWPFAAEAESDRQTGLGEWRVPSQGQSTGHVLLQDQAWVTALHWSVLCLVLPRPDVCQFVL